MTTYLFLGGSADGKWIDVHFEGQPWMISHPVDEVEGWTEVYHPHRLGGYRQTFVVYALDGWNGDDIIDRLINGSRQGEGDPRAQRLSQVRRVRIMDTPGGWTTWESEKMETHMIAELARTAHGDGLKFDGWPKVERTRLVYGDDSWHLTIARADEKADLIEFRVSVTAVPR